MFKKLLMMIGLRAAPRPVQSYVAASSFFGAVPALALVAWKYRGKIAPMLKRSNRLAAPQVPASSAI